MVRPTGDDSNVDVYVVPDMAALPDHVNWTAKLCGRVVLVQGVLKGHRAGPIVTFENAMAKQKRSIVLSDGFRNAFPSRASLLDCQLPTSQWTLIRGIDDFERARDVAREQ